MNEPTQEQIKRFWEWCGFIISGERYYLPGITLKHLIGCPSIDLNNLFKYAVPKLWKAEKVKDLLGEGFITRVVQYPVIKLLPISKGYGDLCYVYNCFLTLHYKPYPDSDVEKQREVHTTDKSEDLALFWAINKVIEGGHNEN